MPRVLSPPGSDTMTISAWGSSAGSSSTPCTGIPSSSRARDATAVSCTSKPDSRAATALPTPPYPSSSTRRSARLSAKTGDQRPAAVSTAKASTCRCAASASATASSAVDVSCTEAALANTSPSGSRSATPSYPIDWPWTRPTSTPSSRASTRVIVM
jgi:hypothetical protein